MLGWPQWIQASTETGTAAPPNSPAPVVDARFPARIADGVWLLTDKRISLVPNIGIVEGDDAVLVIDTGLNEESGQAVLEAAKAIAGNRKLILTTTHAHPEHSFGAQAFTGQAEFYCNKLQRDYLERNGQKLLDGFRKTIPAEHVPLLNDIRITLADRTYNGAETELDLGGRKVTLKTYGLAHSPGDQVVIIPDQKIVFAGDLVEERIFPIVPFFPPMIQRHEINLPAWNAALADMASQKPCIIVPGHGNIAGAEVATDVRNYFSAVQQMVADAKPRKLAPAALAKFLQPKIEKQYGTWERPGFIAPAVQYVAGMA